MTAVIARLLRDRSGATMVEYAVIGALISVALVAAATVIGVSLNGMFAGVSGNFD